MAKTIELKTENGEVLKCTLLNNLTQQAKGMIYRYDHSKYDDIRKAYVKPSYRKIDAFDIIKLEMNNVKGYGMKVCGAGSDIFSCAYKVRDAQGYIYIIYHTPSYRYAILY